MPKRRLLEAEEFEKLKHLPKSDLLQLLRRYVKQPAGRPAATNEPMSGAERARRYRLRKKERR